MLINIMTPAGGGVHTLTRLMDSMDRHLKDVNYNHIILCQGDEATQDFLFSRDHSKITSIYSDVNLKLGVAYNHLMELSYYLTPRCDYMMFLDDDFELLGDPITKLVQYLESTKSDIVALEHSWYNTSHKDRGDKPVNECGGGTLLFTHEVVDKVGYIDEEFACAWDSDWTRRCTHICGLKLRIMPGSLKFARHYSQTGTRKHGMKKFRAQRELDLKYFFSKWGISVLDRIPSADTISRIKMSTPETRSQSLLTSEMVVKCARGVFAFNQ